MRRHLLFLFQPTKHSNGFESDRAGIKMFWIGPKKWKVLFVSHGTGEELEAQLRMVESVVSDEGNTLRLEAAEQS